MLKKLFTWLLGSQIEALPSLALPSPRGTVHKVCPQCQRPNPIPVQTCECGYEFPAGSTALPELANAQELLEHAAKQGLNVSVSVEQRAPSESPAPTAALSTETPQSQSSIWDVIELAARENLDIKVSEKPPLDRPIRRTRKPKAKLPTTVTGRLTYKKVYCFSMTMSGQSTTACHVCLDKHWVFSICVDSAGVEHRCCLRCLYKFGGQEQIDLATKRSGYAAEVWNCIQALDQLRAEFPDPSRRPYGEKTLLNAIERLDPSHPENTERILRKIRVRAWTEYDLARIEGRPEPPSKNFS
jgi:hypothetical protein